MAKTYRQGAADSTSSGTRSNKSNRRPRSLVPSSSLLSILATIAASSSPAHGSPAPPPFLCPFYDSTELSRGLSDDDEHSDKPLHLHPTTTKRRRPRQIPYKYEQGSDGRWRRVEYTLYGSTVCPVRVILHFNTPLSFSHTLRRNVSLLAPPFHLPQSTTNHRILPSTHLLHRGRHRRLLQPLSTIFLAASQQAGHPQNRMKLVERLSS